MSIEQQLANISESQIAILARIDELQEGIRLSQAENQILNQKEAAQLIGISGNTLAKLRKEGVVNAAKYGRAYKYRKADLLKHLNSK